MATSNLTAAQKHLQKKQKSGYRQISKLIKKEYYQVIHELIGDSENIDEVIFFYSTLKRKNRVKASTEEEHFPNASLDQKQETDNTEIPKHNNFAQETEPDKVSLVTSSTDTIKVKKNNKLDRIKSQHKRPLKPTKEYLALQKDKLKEFVWAKMGENKNIGLTTIRQLAAEEGLSGWNTRTKTWGSEPGKKTIVGLMKKYLEYKGQQ